MFRFFCGRREAPRIAATAETIKPLVIPVKVDVEPALARLAELRQSIGETIALGDVLRERLDRLGIRRELS
jgi:hypothetical protein